MFVRALWIRILHPCFFQVQEREGRLPHVLFLQADNCVRENKNEVMLKLLGLLVQEGIFEEVQCFSFPSDTHMRR